MTKTLCPLSALREECLKLSYAFQIKALPKIASSKSKSSGPFTTGREIGARSRCSAGKHEFFSFFKARRAQVGLYFSFQRSISTGSGVFLILTDSDALSSVMTEIGSLKWTNDCRSGIRRRIMTSAARIPVRSSVLSVWRNLVIPHLFTLSFRIRDLLRAVVRPISDKFGHRNCVNLRDFAILPV
jgi:hypothetical protein